MSVKNKTKDRDQHGRIYRKYTSPHCTNFKTPSWWINLRMTRPKRRIDKVLCHKIKNGNLSGDDAVFTLGNRKPHDYFW